MSISDKMQARIKVTAYKNEHSPDDRISLCGEPFKTDANGRSYAVIPAHCAEYQKQLLKGYEFSEEFEVKDGEDVKPQRLGRPRK